MYFKFSYFNCSKYDCYTHLHKQRSNDKIIKNFKYTRILIIRISKLQWFFPSFFILFLIFYGSMNESRRLRLIKITEKERFCICKTYSNELNDKNKNLCRVKKKRKN